MRNDVVEDVGEADGELEGDLAARAVAEDARLFAAHGVHDGGHVACLLDRVDGFGGRNFATGLLPALVRDDGEVLVQVGHDGDEGLALAAGAGDHDQQRPGALVPVDELAAFVLDRARGQGRRDGGWVEGRGDVGGQVGRRSQLGWRGL